MFSQDDPKYIVYNLSITPKDVNAIIRAEAISPRYMLTGVFKFVSVYFDLQSPLKYKTQSIVSSC